MPITGGGGVEEGQRTKRTRAHVSVSTSLSTKYKRTCSKEHDADDLDAHLLIDDVLEQFPIDLEGLGSMNSSISSCLSFPVCMFDIPVPLEERPCEEIRLHGRILLYVWFVSRLSYLRKYIGVRIGPRDEGI